MESSPEATAGARPFDPAELVAHVQWVRRLARALVRDADAAEDLAQETLRVTLDQPGGRVGGGAKLRAWLKRVVSRLAVDRWRAESSRATRERAVAAREAQPATDEIVARLDQQQRVVRAVRELAEPFRSTILYRFLDELTTREVAVRMGVNEELVRKRLLRGFAQLRARLDAEFGSDTKSWAVALLTLPGVAVVSVKAKLAVAAVVVIVAAITWRGLLPTGGRRPAEARPGVAATPAAVSAKKASDASSDAVVREAVTDLDVKKEHASNAAGDATILHVRVVDADHKPCTRGRLVGLWSEATRLESPQTREVRVIESDIAGEFTDIVLPVVTASALLSASVEGQPPSRQESIAELRSEEDPKARHGRVERDVTLTVAGGVASPRLVGRILVDGRPRTPRGLVITYPREAELRVDSIDARYEVGPVDWVLGELFVTSDETVPQIVTTGFTARRPPKGDTTLDLDLSSGITLRLKVLDLRSGSHLPGVELWLRVDCDLVSGTKRGQRSFQHHLVSGPDGIAVVTGLPHGGSFALRRDATLRRRRVEMLPKPPQEMELPREAMLSEPLDASTPAVIERTLRIDAADRTLHVFGDLRQELLGPGEFGEGEAEVRFATRGGDHAFRMPDESDPVPWRRSLASVPHDDQGHWQFEVEPGLEYCVWAEREHRRVSQLVTVTAERADVGPVALPPRPGADVLLRLIHCPEKGRVALFINDRGAAERFGSVAPIHGTTFERRIRLEEPTLVVISVFSDEAMRGSVAQKQLNVDPATTSVVEFDLATSAARRVELEVTAGKLPKTASLWLQRIADDGSITDELSAQIGFVDGVSGDPVAIDPGRYLYALRSDASSWMKVFGVVEVDRAFENHPISIRCELESHKRSELGAGVEMTEVDGVQLGGHYRDLRSVRFDTDPFLAGVDAVFLPKSAKFTILEK